MVPNTVFPSYNGAYLGRNVFLNAIDVLGAYFCVTKDVNIDIWKLNFSSLNNSEI